MSSSLWVVFYRDGAGFSWNAFTYEDEAFDHACENSGLEDGELDTEYSHTWEIPYPDGTPQRHDWAMQILAQKQADRRHERELHSDWMASR